MAKSTTQSKPYFWLRILASIGQDSSLRYSSSPESRTIFLPLAVPGFAGSRSQSSACATAQDKAMAAILRNLGIICIFFIGNVDTWGRVRIFRRGTTKFRCMQRLVGEVRPAGQCSPIRYSFRALKKVATTNTKVLPKKLLISS